MVLQPRRVRTMYRPNTTLKLKPRLEVKVQVVSLNAGKASALVRVVGGVDDLNGVVVPPNARIFASTASSAACARASEALRSRASSVIGHRRHRIGRLSRSSVASPAPAPGLASRARLGREHERVLRRRDRGVSRPRARGRRRIPCPGLRILCPGG